MTSLRFVLVHVYDWKYMYYILQLVNRDLMLEEVTQKYGVGYYYAINFYKTNYYR